MHSGTIGVLLACAYPFFASAFTAEALSARAYLEGGRRLQSQGHLVDAERQFNLGFPKLKGSRTDRIWLSMHSAI